MKRGDRFIAYADRRPAERLFVEVTRVARDGTWADIRVCTWAVMWTKRQPVLLGGWPPESVPREWTMDDLDEQEADHMAKLREQGVLR